MRFGSEAYRFIFAAKRMTAEIDRAFRDSVAQLPPHDARGEPGGKAAAYPGRDGRRPATRSSALASRMAAADRPVERFRVLNGLGAGDRVNPGDQIKIVAE